MTLKIPTETGGILTIRRDILSHYENQWYEVSYFDGEAPLEKVDDLHFRNLLTGEMVAAQFGYLQVIKQAAALNLQNIRRFVV